MEDIAGNPHESEQVVKEIIVLMVLEKVFSETTDREEADSECNKEIKQIEAVEECIGEDVTVEEDGECDVAVAAAGCVASGRLSYAGVLRAAVLAEAETAERQASQAQQQQPLPTKAESSIGDAAAASSAAVPVADKAAEAEAMGSSWAAAAAPDLNSARSNTSSHESLGKNSSVPDAEECC